ncbi:MAG TPA: MarR family transcriptional regulator [Candidatus Hydrogenedens sp.]|nr:MarR family transcriptional regulator [Candidatus Hydrogenedens sp.]HOL18627.1 MarR family transcriptional regulator [Candidatus Hydrogenedens sp.]HPP57527.1 MarR family transcriptional regulator [Candidatus Hydrogenedens sp.]
MERYDESAYEILKTIQMIQRWMHSRFHSCSSEKEKIKFGHDLTMPQFQMLVTIKNYEPLKLKELAEYLYVSPPAASLMLDRLVELGLVVREQSSEDRREIQIRLTPEASKTLKWHENQVLTGISDLLKGLGDETASQWVDVYKKIREYLISVQNNNK